MSAPRQPHTDAIRELADTLDAVPADVSLSPRVYRGCAATLRGAADHIDALEERLRQRDAREAKRVDAQLQRARRVFPWV